MSWRLRALVILLIALPLVTLATYLTVIYAPKKLTEADRAMLRDYNSIRAALAHDDLAAARNEAAAFVQKHAAQKPLAEHAKLLAKASSLDLARTAFSDMSEEATKLAQKNPGYFILGCSMDQCPAKCSPCRMQEYANWVQLQPEVENPYMGNDSPHCGVLKSL